MGLKIYAVYVVKKNAVIVTLSVVRWFLIVPTRH